MEAAHSRLPVPTCLELLPKLYVSAVACLMADKTFVKKTAVSLMKVRLTQPIFVDVWMCCVMVSDLGVLCDGCPVAVCPVAVVVSDTGCVV